MKGTATVTDNDISDQGLPDDDIFAWLQRREMIIEWDRLIRSEGNETIDALYQVVRDAWIEGVRYGSDVEGSDVAQIEVLLGRAEQLVQELLGQVQPPQSPLGPPDPPP